MRELVWLDSALDDLARLREFLAKENPQAAQRAAQAIKETVSKLRELPELGRPVENIIQYRDISVRFGAGGYVLRYRIHHDVIYIVHIRHYREVNFKYH